MTEFTKGSRVHGGEGEFLKRIAEEKARSVNLRVIDNHDVVIFDAHAHKGPLSESLEPTGSMLFTLGERFSVKTSDEELPDSWFNGEPHNGKSNDSIAKAALAAIEMERKLKESFPEVGIVFNAGISPIEIPDELTAA